MPSLAKKNGHKQACQELLKCNQSFYENALIQDTHVLSSELAHGVLTLNFAYNPLQMPKNAFEFLIVIRRHTNKISLIR